MTITRVGPQSCAKIAGIIYGALGLVFGALISAFALLGAAFSSTQSTSAVSPLIGVVMGVGAIVICPVLYGAMGFLLALIGAWLYNLVASRIGGVEIDVAQLTT
jgi:hypothetical protein